MLWSVDVLVAGESRLFLFDLGAGVTTLDRALAAELALPRTGSCAGRRMTGAELTLDLHPPVDLQVGEFVIAPKRIASFELGGLLPADWPPVHGVLALDVLEHIPFTLDLQRDELTFETAETLAERAARAEPLDVDLYRQIADVSLGLLAAVETPAGVRRFELDNSNTGPVVVTQSTFDALALAEDASRAVLTVPGLGVVDTPLVVKPILYDGNLGRTVLDGRVLTFDLATERVLAAHQRATAD